MNRNLDPVEIYLFNEGKNAYAYRGLGCKPYEENGAKYHRFAVWAPHAKRVSVVGDFNGWNPEQHPLEPFEQTGVWYGSIEGLKNGDLYKYSIQGPDGQWHFRSDPFAFAAELRPGTASKVWDSSDYVWNDQAWLEKRAQTAPYDRPMAIYEVHLGSWRDKQSYREIAEELGDYLLEMGYTHVEFMPLAEYPLDMSWGYQITNYYAATARYGTPQDLMYLIDSLHQKGIGVIMDWVPGHFPKDEHGLRNFDGQTCYEYADSRIAETEWDTLQFDYGKGEVISFLMSNAIFWLDQFHVDGLRADAVSSMLYINYSKKNKNNIRNVRGGEENLEGISFLQRTSELIFRDFPNVIFAAEEATAYPLVTAPVSSNGLGFNYKWNMGWMHDTLDYFSMDPLGRKYNQNLLTFSMMYAFSENFILPISHDEVVHGKKSLIDKMQGDYEQKFASMRAFYAYMFAHPGKKLMFMGSEFGQFIEWRYNESLEWFLLEYDKHRQLQDCAKAINHFYKSERAFYEIDDSWDGFKWLCIEDKDMSIVAFARFSRAMGAENDLASREIIICAFNFTPVTRKEYRIGVPMPGYYEEVLSTDRYLYGGGGEINKEPIKSERIQSEQCQDSISLTLGGLCGTYLRYIPFSDAEYQQYLSKWDKNLGMVDQSSEQAPLPLGKEEF